MEPRKQAIIEALAKFIRQRPGLEYGNYGDAKSYAAECRRIARDKREALTLLTAVSWRDGIDADALIKAATGAYSGRLTITEEQYTPASGPALATRVDIDYCTGQYFPTEYRRAVCAVLASALWDYTREKAMPGPLAEDDHRYKSGREYLHAGEWLRAHFRKEFGRGIAARWFS